jgi:hypothetical protein
MDVSKEIDAAVERALIWPHALPLIEWVQRVRELMRAELLAAEKRGAAEVIACPDPDAHGPCDVNDRLAAAEARLAAVREAIRDIGSTDWPESAMEMKGHILKLPDWDPIGGPIVPGDFPAHPDAVPLSAAELVRRTYPPSATAQRAKALANRGNDPSAMSWRDVTAWVIEVRDFLRDLSREAT